MAQSSPGHFWAVGVGPGDPELLTVKALNVIQCANVIYHAGPQPRRGRAFEIVASHLRPEQEPRIVLTESMSAASATDWRLIYRPAVEAIAADCRSGRDVALITEGDPTLYSTAAYVWQLLGELYPDIAVEVVPGVSSVAAAAARALRPLTQKDDILAVVPAHHHAGELGGWLDRCSTVCFLKPTTAVAEIAAALGPDHETLYAENLGRPEEWLTTDLSSAVERNCYFSLVQVTKRREPARAGSASKGTARAALTVVGLGPGALDLLTPRALTALRRADVIVGYDGYLQRLAPLRLRAELRGSPIGAETERARLALDLLRRGRQVALVSSGDAGVYGMASLLLETVASAGDLDIAVVPGVTAATAAAALLGAPLGHDFACISLSDLLTPWQVIESRLDAAGRGDLVVALYNPVSAKRTWQLPRAREILLRHRAPNTPVGIVDRAERWGCRVQVTCLDKLTPDELGMETMVVVGNSQTRVINNRLVTPRGYAVNSGSSPSPGALRRPLAVERPALAGRDILDESFATIERELGDHSLPPWALAVVRRMIHASADFEFAQTLRHSPDFAAAMQTALAAAKPVIVTDTEMVLVGIRAACGAVPRVTAHCHLNNPEVEDLAATCRLTRSAAGIRVAAGRHARPILAIGNAPTALEEALRQVIENGWRPAAIIGIPVGFVGVEDAKGRLLAQSQVPYLTCVGRKGGSAVTAAAVNALLEWYTAS
jgi:precorrin-2 C(20)-methyltransferase